MRNTLSNLAYLVRHWSTISPNMRWGILKEELGAWVFVAALLLGGALAAHYEWRSCMRTYGDAGWCDIKLEQDHDNIGLQ